MRGKSSQPRPRSASQSPSSERRSRAAPPRPSRRALGARRGAGALTRVSGPRAAQAATEWACVRPRGWERPDPSETRQRRATAGTGEGREGFGQRRQPGLEPASQLRAVMHVLGRGQPRALQSRLPYLSGTLPALACRTAASDSRDRVLDATQIFPVVNRDSFRSFWRRAAGSHVAASAPGPLGQPPPAQRPGRRRAQGASAPSLVSA